jgi:hypothetical protein
MPAPVKNASFSEIPNLYESEMKSELLDAKFNRYDCANSIKILAEDPNEVLGSNELEEKERK